MKARVLCTLLAVLVGLAFGWLLHPYEVARSGIGPPEPRPTQQLAQSRKIGVRARPAAAPSPTAAKWNANSDEYVDLKRAEQDRAYALGPLRRHRAIKSYLASPITGDELLQKVLCFLLQNGFSIDDLFTAYLAVRLADMGCPDRARFEATMQHQGVSKDAWERNWETALSEHWNRELFQIQTITGLEDQTLLAGLASLAPNRGEILGPANTFLPQEDPVEGERLLTDRDWMTEPDRAAAAQYQGPPRSFTRTQKPPQRAPPTEPRLVDRPTF